MKLADVFPFYPSLGNPALDGPIDHTPDGPLAGDVVVTAQWQIVAVQPGAPDDGGIEVAARDLQELLATAFGVAAPVGVGPGKPRQILLRRAAPGALASNSPEAHRIVVTDDQVVVEGNTGPGVLHGAFHVADLMRERGGPFLARGTIERAPLFERRIHRSAVSPFYIEEAAGYTGPPYLLRELNGYRVLYSDRGAEDAGLDGYYADHVLLGLARHGFNGIWLRGVLRLLSATTLYPDGAAYAAKALPRIRDLCRRAARYGIGVYLYLNEPLGFPREDPFWTRHRELQGALIELDSYHALCTSQPEALEFCREGMRDLCSRVPELAGAILISASEFPTHCWSRGPVPAPKDRPAFLAKGLLCPRCAERDPSAVVAEVVTALRDGLKAGNPDADLIAWNWSWNRYEPDPQPKILAGLPEDAMVMGDFERGAPARALDLAYRNEEYALKVVGPSDRFLGCIEHQRARGLPTYAKLQIGTTHEDPTVPYLPVLPSIALKYRAMRDLGVAGIVTCWNFGNLPSIATEAANAFSWAGPGAPDEPIADVLRRVAARYFGARAAPVVVEAWQAMYDAFARAYPGQMLYNGPISRGPAVPFVLERLHRQFPPTWLLVADARADDARNWLRGGLGADLAIRCMAALDAAWTAAIAYLESARPLTQGSGRRALEREIGVAKTCVIQFRTTANLVEFLAARDASDAATEPAERRRLLDQVAGVARRERENAASALPLVDADPRLGFHGEAYGYLFNRPLIEQKLAQLDRVLEVELPAALTGAPG